MERYEGNHGLAAIMGFSGVCTLALVGFCVVQAAPQFADLHELTKHGGLFRPGRVAGILLLICIVPTFLIGGMETFDPAFAGHGDQAAFSKSFGLFFIASSLAIAVLGVHLVSQKLTVTADGIALQSLFLDRWIPFDGVESNSVKTYDGARDELVEERATIRGLAGQKIVLQSSMPGYRSVLELVRTHTNPKPRCGSIDDCELA